MESIIKYREEIQACNSSPRLLEELYQSALRQSQADQFHQELLDCYAESPENQLLAAWFYRLEQSPKMEILHKNVTTNWNLAILLSIVTSSVLGMIAYNNDKLFLDHSPYFLVFWSPIAALSAIVFLTGTAKKNYGRAVMIAAAMLLSGVYVLLMAPSMDDNFQTSYLNLMVIHLPLIAWIALGITVLGIKSRSEDRFVFLIKSIETMITAGLYLTFGIILGVITFGMLDVLNVEFPDAWVRLIIAGGFGLLPTAALAAIYDPVVRPTRQDFSQGLSQFIATMMRLLLPITLIVLVMYVILIPFNFIEPFRQRDVLIVYNALLFAIVGLLIGATPLIHYDVTPKMRTWLRNGILAVAFLGTVISIYALSAILYRTVNGGFTPNRLTVMGWNTINIGILIALIAKQLKGGSRNWVDSLQQVFSFGTNCYVTWGVFLLVAIPLIFG